MCGMSGNFTSGVINYHNNIIIIIMLQHSFLRNTVFSAFLRFCWKLYVVKNKFVVVKIIIPLR